MEKRTWEKKFVILQPLSIKMLDDTILYFAIRYKKIEHCLELQNRQCGVQKQICKVSWFLVLDPSSRENVVNFYYCIVRCARNIVFVNDRAESAIPATFWYRVMAVNQARKESRANKGAKQSLYIRFIQIKRAPGTWVNPFIEHP